MRSQWLEAGMTDPIHRFRVGWIKLEGKLDMRHEGERHKNDFRFGA